MCGYNSNDALTADINGNNHVITGCILAKIHRNDHYRHDDTVHNHGYNQTDDHNYDHNCDHNCDCDYNLNPTYYRNNHYCGYDLNSRDNHNCNDHHNKHNNDRRHDNCKSADNNAGTNRRQRGLHNPYR